MTTDVKKLTNTKEVITYLAEKFPQCFTVEGDAKPLKIGIFEDLAARLADDETVSKTRLRTALRHYTNSWRYLRSVKVGTQRVDLDGADAGIIEEEHQQHAEQTLAESKAVAAERAAAKRKEQAAQAKAAKPANQEARKARAKRPTKKPAAAKPAPAPKLDLQAVKGDQLRVGQQVQVKAGLSPIAGQVTEIDRDDIYVQLQNGLTVKVNVNAVFVTK
ncbi:RNA chaperone ProQ [Pseudidiomarina gelatinasegens]|uniref:RNA chaperone ProQ n=1 Tax=Pseudidiomarina gelatinasegens TaxID=2487740 RepID=A0A443Z6J9_9GAMM|nr:RNA chaperone ProQ [Pseudidiomarina gelatinasegens]RWU12407.1 RNA chaperone ProQ [Pseudidiomarina gelatinasegens]